MVSPLLRNMVRLLEKGRERSTETVAVTKGFCADRKIVELLWEAGYAKFADANLDNLLRLRRIFGNRVELQLIRMPMCSELARLVEADVVPHVSHKEILEHLSVLSHRRKKVTPVILSVEAGDGREGFLPEEILEERTFLKTLEGIRVNGLSTTLACLSGVLPQPPVIERLRKLRDELSDAAGPPEFKISVGGTTFLSLWEGAAAPEAVDEIRCGEAWLFGTDISRKKSFAWLEQDTFFLSAEIVEVKSKNPAETAVRGYDAFGRTAGERRFRTSGKRALAACGLQDVDETQLYLLDDHVKIVGATSNYLVLEVSRNASPVTPGCIIRFRAGYGTVLRAFLSPYVDKVYL